MGEIKVRDRILQKIKEAQEKQLDELDLSNDWDTPDQYKLTEIPEEVFELKHLKILNLSNHKISHIPESLDKLTSLNTIDLRGNPLEEPPLEIIRQGVEAIKKYFEQLKKM